MELASIELLETAKKFESEKLAKIKFDPTCIIDLDGLLGDTYDRQCPKPVDYHNRRDLIRIFNLITKEIYGHSENSPVVKEYGSFVMDIFNERSDLDLSINFSNSIEVTRQKQKETLRKFSGKLRSIQRNGHVIGLQCILTAKVPIIKVTDSGTGIECDLSVHNRDGIAKSHIIRVISAIDERFQKLSFLMKSWAKAHNINSSKDATLNSFSIISFVALHLQTCNPPILPPFSALLEAVTDPESAAEIVKPYINYGKQNKESLAMLFITLLVKVEDFTDRSQNVARAVGTNGFKMIYNCIHTSLNHISQFLNGQIQGVELMDHLFGTHVVSTVGVSGTRNFRENKKNHLTLHDRRPLKKKRLVESGMHLRSGNTVQHSHDCDTPSIPTKTKAQTLQNNTFFTPSIPYRSPFDSPSTNIKVHHGYGLGHVPPPVGLNPIVFQRSYIPSVQSHHVLSQSSGGFVQPFHHKAVDSNPYHGSFTSSSQQGKDHY